MTPAIQWARQIGQTLNLRFLTHKSRQILVAEIAQKVQAIQADAIEAAIGDKAPKEYRSKQEGR